MEEVREDLKDETKAESAMYIEEIKADIRDAIKKAEKALNDSRANSEWKEGDKRRVRITYIFFLLIEGESVLHILYLLLFSYYTRERTFVYD